MNDVIRFNYEEDGHRILRLSGGAVFNPRGETVMARIRDGKLLGGIVYSNYTKRSIEMHTAGFVPRWVNRNILWAAFDYPFNQLGCEKVFGRVQASNEQAMRFDLSLGFTVETVVKDVYPDGDLNVMSMYKADCRHLNIRPRGLHSNERP